MVQVECGLIRVLLCSESNVYLGWDVRLEMQSGCCFVAGGVIGFASRNVVLQLLCCLGWLLL